MPAGGSDELRELAESDIRSAFDSLAPEPNWRLEFWGGSIGPTLVGQAREADLLVIGTREHTGVDRVLSGSESHYRLSHAKCPIVAVPPMRVAVGHHSPPARHESASTG
jgi:nucleotide-binding universal stress UspA family protein